MRNTQVTPVGGSPTTLNGYWTLDTPATDGARRYRQVLQITLATGGHAEDLVLDPSTELRIQPLNRTLETRDANSPEPVTVTKAPDNGLEIRLPYAREIDALRLSSAKGAGRRVELYRTDGEVIAEEAFASWPHPVASQGGKSAGKAKGGSGAKAQTQAQSASQLAEEGKNLAAVIGREPIIDRRLVVRLSGRPELAPADLKSLTLAIAPENLRLGLRLPALDAETYYLPLTLEAGKELDAGEPLHRQLTDLIRRLRKAQSPPPSGSPPKPLPDPLILELVLEADAPCGVRICDYAVDYALRRASLPDGALKQVLRLDSQGPTVCTLPIQVPAGIVLRSAVLTLAGAGTSMDGGGAAVTGDLGALLATAGTQALHLTPDRRWASPWSLAEAQLLDGWNLLLWAGGRGLELSLELIADRDGQPLGERLARAELSLSRASVRRWVRIELEQRQLLQAADYWLLLACHAGNGGWHLEPGTGRPLLADGTGWTTARGSEGQRGIARALIGERGGTAARGEGGLELRLGGLALDPLPAQDGDVRYDMSAAAALAAGNPLATVQLELLGSGDRPLTLYPPELLYDL